MQRKSQQYLFLYSRLPDYFFRCVQYLLEKSPAGSQACIVCYPQDANAPYRHEEVPDVIRIVEKKNLAVIDHWQPDIIYIAGWGDKDYNQVAAKWINRVPVIVGMDNPWKGSLKQKFACFIAPFYLKNKATHLWVAGYPQYEYARRMGFPANRILHDLYCADTSQFRKSLSGFRKRIVFVGRMVAYKRPGWLVETFNELLVKHPELQDWELLMIGNGPLQQDLQKRYARAKQVSFLSFVQPAELVQYYHQSAVFCMPSAYEHWGVVVQEAAAAELALLLSDTCGAASTFLINGFNGYVFDSDNKDDFRKKLDMLMKEAPASLQQMGKQSVALSERITHDTWCGNLKSVLNG